MTCLTQQHNKMRLKTIWIGCVAFLFLSCNPQYKITEMSGTIIEMNAELDRHPHPRMEALVQSYKTELDKEMDVVIGNSAQFMNYKRPESLLTNLTSDVMRIYGLEHLSNATVISIMNLYGHRANLPKGNITMRNLYETYPFDNTIIFLELKGSDLKKIFDAYARIGGAGISSNVKLVINHKKVKKATIDGNNIDPSKIYHIVTLDYLAEGNDNMSAFRNAVSHIDTGITLRDMMIDWVKEQTRRGEEIQSQLDGRITIQ